MKKLESSLTNMVLVLTGVAVIMGGILAYVNHLTEGPIAAQKEKALADGIKTVMCVNDLKVAKTDEVKQKRIDLFMAKLDNMLEITAKQLDDRFQFQKTAFAKQFPLLMQNLWIGADKLKPMDTIESVINQGTLGIGFIGLAECLVALIGKHHGESQEAQELGLKIIGYMRERSSTSGLTTRNTMRGLSKRSTPRNSSANATISRAILIFC